MLNIWAYWDCVYLVSSVKKSHKKEHLWNISSQFYLNSGFKVLIVHLAGSLCLFVLPRTATWGIFSAHASLSRGAVPMIRLNTGLLFCLAVPLKPTLCLPTPWLSAATVVPAGPTPMSAHTEPAQMEQNVPSQLGVSIRTLARATMLSLSDSHAFVLIMSNLVATEHKYFEIG